MMEIVFLNKEVRNELKDYPLTTTLSPLKRGERGKYFRMMLKIYAGVACGDAFLPAARDSMT